MTSREIVLVVDDLPDSLSMVNAALEEAGLTVLVAQEGARALEIAEKVTPDIILMDAVMPEMDGFETCRRLKALPATADVPVVFMTGLSETEHVVRGFEAGGVDYVTKPIVAAELMARLRVHLVNARMTRSARMALDATGRFLLAVDARGRALWHTPQTAERLSRAFPGDDDAPALPEDAERRLAGLVTRGEGTTALADDGPGARFQVALVGRTGEDEFLLRLTEGRAESDEDRLHRRLKLTQREAEVLLWLAHGKANRDIADILGLSPRTVDKHLEQIYGKLGVENRTSAAARAMRALEEE